MSSTPTTWMPLDIGDYLADTMDLSAEYHGAYLLLIMHYWKNRGPIKNDKKSIKNVCKVSSNICEEILRRFFQLSDGVWHHRRIDDELNKAINNKEKKQKQTEAARAARYGKTCSVTENVTDTVTSLTRAELPSPSPLPIEVLEASPLPPSASVDNSQGEALKKIKGGKLDEVDAGGYDVLKLLDPIELAVAKSACEYWDIIHLANVFNKNVHLGILQKPHSPAKAFPAWLRKYTKGRRP